MPDFDNPVATKPAAALEWKYLIVRKDDKTVEVNYGNGVMETLDAADYNAAEFSELKAGVKTAVLKAKAKIEAVDE